MNTPIKGRGATSNKDGRYNLQRHDSIDDGWYRDEADQPVLKTTVTKEAARTIITRNTSPDIPFDQSINPYRGCEHGCIYCYARPTHAYLGLSPGLDFESRLTEKPNAAQLLKGELGKASYRCRVLALGTNTDPYQPIERDRGITREILTVLSDCNHPVMITTKSSLIERDIDILKPMANRSLACVLISITTLDRDLARRFEPRAAQPERRMDIVTAMAEAGIPVGVMIAPIVPFLTDHELESIMLRSSEAGACSANYIILRMPLEIKDLFGEWLATHYPMKAERIFSTLKSLYDGELYQSNFGTRQTGTGTYADLLRQRYQLSLKRTGLSPKMPVLDTSQFTRPGIHAVQSTLF